MPRAVDGWKKCSKCGVTKEATRENYPPHRQTADRFDSRCRECMRPLHRARMRAILATPEGQAYEAARNATPERKAYMATYNDAPERKADARVRMRNYRATPEGMAYNEFIKGPRLDDLRARLAHGRSASQVHLCARGSRSHQQPRHSVRASPSQFRLRVRRPVLPTRRVAVHN